mmetsp:Transcript_123732/g.214495  ORF Transcript_123732/g.214495 Transcript_123732/m.214495 type:complete len:182 (-) Transcript_123732:42-587(-)
MSDDEDYPMDEGGENEGFSAKTLCVGLCGVCPSIVWIVALAAIAAKTMDEADESDTDPDTCGSKLPAFIWGSVAAFVVLVLIQCVNAFLAGEPDFEVSPVEMITFGATMLMLIFLYCFNYWGFYVIMTTETKCSGAGVAWVALIGNNIVWFSTLATIVASMVCAAMVAGTDKVANMVGFDM